jgi:hypothetical protein
MQHELPFHLPVFSHVEVDGLDEVPFEDSEILRLPDPQRLKQLEDLRIEFLNRWQTGDDIEELIARIFAVPTDAFLPAFPPRYIVGYNVQCPAQARIFRRVMRDLDRYIAVLSRFALRVRVLSVARAAAGAPRRLSRPAERAEHHSISGRWTLARSGERLRAGKARHPVLAIPALLTGHGRCRARMHGGCARTAVVQGTNRAYPRQ